MYGNTSMMELECYLRYCIDQHYLCKVYNYVKNHFSMPTLMTVSFHLAMSRPSMWGGLQCELALHVHFIWVQFESYAWSPCIWRMSKLEVVRVLCMNLKTLWSWTPNWKQTWKLNKCDELYDMNILWKGNITCMWVRN
jgi:hypothetical protein